MVSYSKKMVVIVISVIVGTIFVVGALIALTTKNAQAIGDPRHVAEMRTKLLRCHEHRTCAGGYVIWKDGKRPIQWIVAEGGFCDKVSCRMNPYFNYEPDLVGSNNEYLDKIIVVLPTDKEWTTINYHYGRQFVKA